MPYKTFVAGEILTASQVMTYFMNQANIVCTSGTRPSSPTAGMEIFEIDTNRKMIWDGVSAWVNMTTIGAWTPYTPAWSSSGTNPSTGNGSLQGRYKRVGDLVHVWLRLEFGSTTNGGTGAWSFTLPVAPTEQDILPAMAVDSSPVGRYSGIASLSTSGFVDRVMTPGGASNIGNTATIPFTWADGDYLQISGSYRAV